MSTDEKIDKSNLDNKSSLNTLSGNEIVTLCVGHCGCFIGQEFYSTIMNEKSIDKQGKFVGNMNTINDKLQTSKTNVYFDEIDNKYIPRSIFFDLDAKSMNQIRSGYIGSLIPNKNLMSLPYAVPSSIWAIGHYTEGAEIIYDAEEIVRNTVETCDYLQGFNLLHGICGGVGGGFGSLLLYKLRDNYPDKHTFTFSIYPGQRHSMYSEHNAVIQTYNTVLSFHTLQENASLCFSIDNGKLWKICSNKLRLENPTYDDINWILSLVFSSITSTLRFETEPNINTTLKRMNEYFTPNPRLHYVSVSHSPFFTNSGYRYYQTTEQILSDVMSDSNSLIYSDSSSTSRYGGPSDKTMNMCCIYRGNSENRINVRKMMYYSEDFVSWLPPSIGSTLIHDNNCYEKYTPLMATVISHTTKIKSIWTNISVRFSRLYKRKTKLHLYKGEGMGEYEFQEAARHIRYLCDLYKEQETLIVEMNSTDYDYEEEEDQEETEQSEDEQSEDEQSD